MIEVTNLRKYYGSLAAVDGVSFTVADGETFGLLGPNGAGKTTTMHMVTGALTPDAGRININGQQEKARADVRYHLGLAPQSLALYESLTAEENLSFFAKLYGLHGAKLRERVDFTLGLSGLTDRRRDLVKTYSGGMKRRLNLACALVHDPSVVILDEPTVGVDPQSRNYLFDTIEKLAAEGRTIIYTTHYMEEAQRLCDRVAIMDHGKILALDTIPGLIAGYGGKARVEAELAQTPASLADLPAPLDGLKLHYDSDRPFEEGSRLAALGLKLTAFRIDPPDLEKVFLNLTGRSLRD
jgi:linearmycin/streptolysin S transport system ATP-binding protein